MASHSNEQEQKLFPSKLSLVIFISYISLFVSQYVLTAKVKKSKIPGFNAIAAVLLTESVKLIICVAVYILRSQGSLSKLIVDFSKNGKLLLLYLVPSFLYCIYNNLTYINLGLFDLTTYTCLMQFRIVLTAVIYQVMFRRPLTGTQWMSLIILTLGCLIKEFGLYDDIAANHSNAVGNQTTHNTQDHQSNDTAKADDRDILDGKSTPLLRFAWLTSLILFQMFCSCFAGVYNEYLLKDSSNSKRADIILQNIFMYLDSIVCNMLVYKVAADVSEHNAGSNNELGTITTLHNLVTNPLTFILIVNNACSGLVASFFLKNLNSILKTFASALELFAIAIFAWYLFDSPIDLHTIFAMVLVSAAMIVYSRNPVSVAPPGHSSSDSHNKDGFMLLPTTEN